MQLVQAPQGQVTGGEIRFNSSELGKNAKGEDLCYDITKMPTLDMCRIRGKDISMIFQEPMTSLNPASIGSFSARTAVRYAEHYLGSFALSTRNFVRRQTAPLAASFDRTITRHTHQAHCILGARAYDLQDEKRLPLSLLINRLGGPCANSILNVEVRERHGLTYNIEANYTPYNDAGVVAIYFSSDHNHTDDCLELIHRQINLLRTKPITARQLAMAKRQFIAQMAISCENKENYILGAGKAILAHGEMDTMEEAYRKIQALTANQLQEVAEEVFANLSKLTFK